MDQQNLFVLNRLLAREARTLLQYLSGAWPWVAPDEEASLAQLQALQVEEQKATRRIYDFILRRHGVPDTGRFAQEFSNTHFIALDHLLPWLLSYQQWLIAELEKDLRELTDAQARTLAQDHLELKRRHLAELQKLAEQHAGQKMVSTLK
jgi:hypothetical protein